MNKENIKQIFLQILKQYGMIALGSAILAPGLNQFLVPLKLSSGGISAVGGIMLHLFHVPLSVTNLICNAVLFLFGFRYLGKSGVAKTVAGIIFLSFFLQVCTYFPVYTADVFAAMVMGGVLVGIGVGFVVREGASTGGSDFAALMIHKFLPHISVASIIMAIDCTIVAISGIVFKSLTVTVYSIISLYLSAKITDLVMIVGNKAKFAYVISPRQEEIAGEIMEKFERGVTGIYCKGMYSGEDKTMLLCVVSPKEMPKLVETVKKYDKTAFIIVSDAKEVLGEGFIED